LDFIIQKLKTLAPEFEDLILFVPAIFVLQYSTVQYSTVQYSTVQCSAVQYSTVQYSAVEYSTSTQGSTEPIMVVCKLSASLKRVFT
jgi:hypothetical protein